jgi:DNA-binding cell septation regulator SpoVG
MQITKIKIKKTIRKEDDKGLVGFVSLVIDSWLQIGNVAIYERLYRKGEIRLVFPYKEVNNRIISFVHPLDSSRYFELEKAVLDKYNNS